ncbi:MAG: acetolactate synthase large subunit [Ornithinimicrobium sp.]|uniref:acetolactate synthase large subunit n=1 Tax=Ornithinimicrobium sp. TaxID=1977084 RepID=UPI0026E01E78|nr:acetolactate synthase large subunit [Ornithinimicrobium sp.]MDO5739952.1 acetolactate synthase large subunit [Ornithinimicrobium sp.]
MTATHLSSEHVATGAPSIATAPRGAGSDTGAAMMTGAQSLVTTLQRIGVEHIFGLPGGAVLPLYDALYGAEGIRHILVRHEQGAGHAATGYAAATGKVGVCLATSGPGATNLVTPLADANMDSIPVVAITGNVPSTAMGTDAFQEADIRSISMPVTKHSFLVTNPHDVAATIASAFHLAQTGRPGPVLVDITKDALVGLAEPGALQLAMPGYHPATSAAPESVRDAIDLMLSASRPVLYVGGGTVRSGAAEHVRTFAELTGMPVVTTLMARGAFPDSHPQHMGMPGMHGTVAAVAALQKSDLIISLGARFDDRVTGAKGTFAPHARIIHADIDPAEIGKNFPVEVGLVGDAKDAIDQLVAEWIRRTTAGAAPDYEAWVARCLGWKASYPLGYDAPTDGALAPQYVIERLGALSPQDTIYAAGVGQHQMWATHFIKYEKPNRWLNSGGLGTMGYAVPAAMGAKVGMPDTTVWAIDGDGSFQMTNQELATCAVEGIPIKVAIINNAALGMVRQWQALFYSERFSASQLPSKQIPDFATLAQAYGCVGLRCESAQDVDATIEAALEVTDQPVVVDFRVSKDSMVWPMVPSGTSNDAIQHARDVCPEFGED